MNGAESLNLADGYVSTKFRIRNMGTTTQTITHTISVPEGLTVELAQITGEASGDPVSTPWTGVLTIERGDYADIAIYVTHTDAPPRSYPVTIQIES